MLLQQWRARSQQGLCSKRRPWIVTTYNPPNAPTSVCVAQSGGIRGSTGGLAIGYKIFAWIYTVLEGFIPSVSYGKARYWADKLHGSNPGVHGGHRYQTLTQEAQLALEWTIFLIWEADESKFAGLPSGTDIEG
eukprot:g83428.t1